MTIYLYSNFSKRVNSSKQPATGTSVTCVLKDDTSIENPVFQLSGGISSYADVTAVSWDGRYYFVNDIISEANGITSISCTIDRGATFRSDIMADREFIERSAALPDVTISDPMASTQNKTFFEVAQSSTEVFPPNTGQSLNNGYIALQVISSDTSEDAAQALAVYFLPMHPFSGTYSDCKDLMNELWNNSLYDSVQKVLASSTDAIVRATYIPVLGFESIDTPGENYYQSGNPIIGNYTATGLTVKKEASLHLFGCGLKEKTYDFDLSSIAHYNTYTWRNKEPYSKWGLYLPYLGYVPFSADEFLDDVNADTTMRIRAALDTVTGDIIYRRQKKVAGTPNKYYDLDIYKTCCGVTIPLSQMVSSGLPQLVSSIIEFAAGIASQNYMMAAAAVPQGVMSAMQKNVSATPGTTAGGVLSSLIERENKIAVYQMGKEVISPLSYIGNVGNMFMNADTLSNHSGYYVKCRNASCSMGGTQADKDAVNAMLENGFFLE